MNAFFFGAGSSFGTLRRNPACPPIGADFGKVLAEIPASKRKYPAIAQVAEHLRVPLKELSLEQIWTCIDYHSKLVRALPTTPPWFSGADDRATPDLKRALLRLYGRACDRAADALPRSDAYTLGHLLKNRMRKGDLVISFNYDTVVERLARRFGHRLVNVGAARRRNAVEIAKPHGSTSWYLDLNKRGVVSAVAGAPPLVNSLAESDVARGKHPLLLGAVPFKSELITEVQRGWLSEVFDAVVRQWKAVVEALRVADTFVVVGYSFPREDHYGRFLFWEGIRLRSRPVKVDYYELPDRAASTAASILEAFPGEGIRLEWRGEVTPP